MKSTLPLNIYPHRGVSHGPATVLPSTTLPPRELFTGREDVLAAYDAYLGLSEAVRRHSAEEARLRAEARNAEQQHARDLRDAMAAGADVSKIKNHAEALTAEADRHAALYAEAKRGTHEAGDRLGHALAQAAPELFPQLEATMTEQAAKITEAVEQLRHVWATWQHAWQVRRILSGVAIVGGPLDSIRPARLPAPVSEALASLDDHVRMLDRLKSDEAEILAWREAQAVAVAANQRLAQHR